MILRTDSSSDLAKGSSDVPAIAVGDWNSGGTSVFSQTSLELQYVHAEDPHAHDHIITWKGIQVKSRTEDWQQSDGYWLTDHPMIHSELWFPTVGRDPELFI